MSTWYYTTTVVLGRSGGQTTRVLEFCRALGRHVNVAVFAPLGGTRPPELGPAVRFVDVPVPARPPRNLGYQLNLWRALRREPVPDVYYTYAGSLNLPGLWYARRRGIPALMEINGILSMEYPLEHPPRTALDRVLLAARTAMIDMNAWIDYRVATGILPVTERLIDYIGGRYGIPRDRFCVVTNGADPEAIQPQHRDAARERLGLRLPGPLAGYVGILAAWQGVDVLLRAFALARAGRPDLSLLILGSGTQEPALRALASELGVQAHVLWPGRVPHAQVADYLAACDVLAAPFTLSPRNQAMGISALKLGEYMAAGRPILSTACPGLEFIAAEDIGRLARPDDPRDLARALLDLLAGPETAAALGARARHLAETRYSWDALVRRAIEFAEQSKRRQASA